MVYGPVGISDWDIRRGPPGDVVVEQREDYYDKVPESTINAERFDQAPCLVARKIRYVLCSTQRSGSFLLCRQLINAGIGVPQEYFNPLHVQTLCSRWGFRPRDEGSEFYIRALYDKRTAPNGVWGTKLQWWQYQKYQPAIDRALRDTACYIYLYRTDTAAQAVSLHLSIVTGIWGFDGAKTTREQPHIHMGDLGHVARCEQIIAGENKNWEDFFARRKIQCLSIQYEKFVADQSGYITLVAQFLGLRENAYRLPPPEPRENQWPNEIDAVRRELLQRLRAAQ